MKINNTNIDFYNQDEKYIKQNLVFKYKCFLTIVSSVTGLSNKTIHEFNKETLDMVSIKQENIDKISVKELIDSLNSVEEFWNKEHGLVFMP